MWAVKDDDDDNGSQPITQIKISLKRRKKVIVFLILAVNYISPWQSILDCC